VRRAAVLIAIAVAGAGCRTHHSYDDPPPAGSAQSAQPRMPTAAGPVKVDALIKQACDDRKDLTVSRIDAKYVHSDGTIDATYGELELNLIGPEPPPPPDDPNRPTGAPVPDPEPSAQRDRDCEDYRWSATTGWAPKQDSYMKMCLALGSATPIKCTVIQIWQRAIADGAPANALAHVSMLGGMGWDFSIDDAPRDVHISKVFDDNCAPAAEAGP
jgi:hypothetical protein